jgi:hypothetical protein
MNCLDEGALLRVCSGDATDAECRHATACATCTHALAMLQADLGRLGAVLGDGVPVRRTARRRGMRLVPIAAAAASCSRSRRATDAGSGRRRRRARDAGRPRHRPSPRTTSAGSPPTTTATTAQSTCTWGEPLLETGCDDDAPATLIAWR